MYMYMYMSKIVTLRGWKKPTRPRFPVPFANLFFEKPLSNIYVVAQSRSGMVVFVGPIGKTRILWFFGPIGKPRAPWFLGGILGGGILGRAREGPGGDP